MELLIPGLILVALMVWASTKIKKTAADAFEAESIEAENYSLQKPEGFLHVLVDSEHELYAYSREYGEGSSSKLRRATIEIDILKSASLAQVRDEIKNAPDVEIVREIPAESELETDESANESSIRAFYKIVGTQNEIYRLRFAVLSAHLDEYLDRVRDTLDSFSIRSN